MRNKIYTVAISATWEIRATNTAQAEEIARDRLRHVFDVEITVRQREDTEEDTLA